MIIDANNRPVPIVLLLVEALKKIKAGDRFEEYAICANVVRHLQSQPDVNAKAAFEILRRKLGQWADKKNAEPRNTRNRSAAFPIPHLGPEAANGTIWKNRERLQLLEWLIDQLSMTPKAMTLECLYGVHPVVPDSMLQQCDKEFAICTQTQTLLDLMPARKKWPEECAEKVRWHDCVRISQNILDHAIMAWPEGTGSTNFPVEGSQMDFSKAFAKGMLWNDQRRWQLWYFMVQHLEEAV